MDTGKIISLPASEVLPHLLVRPIWREERSRWDATMRQHHYLGFHSLVGESIRYVALWQDQWLALLGWAAAALKCQPRDQWIGWPPWLKWLRLPFIANNTRFLLLPPIRIPNLASRILALNLKRLSQDWQTAYHHPIWLAETFVDPRYFQGTCYRAAGWTLLGFTQGFGKHSQGYRPHEQPKMVFVRPLHPQAKEKLANPSFVPELPKVSAPKQISEKQAADLLQRLRQIRDPRLARGIRHRKFSILAISICALLCQARSFAAIAEWAQRCSQNMLKRLGCRYHKKTQQYLPPSEPTIRRFLQAVDAQAIDQALGGWLQSLGGTDAPICVDGKTLKGARQNDGHSVHLLSAFLQQHGIVLAQRQVPSSTNEIPTLQPLLTPLDLQERVVTVDALHTQKETARYLVEDKQADYLFTVKENQKTLYQDIADLKLVDFPPSAPNNR